MGGFEAGLNVVSKYQIKTQQLQDKPAIVVAAFGTSSKAQATFDFFDQQLRQELPDYEIRWAFTSEIIRERLNRRFIKEGVGYYLESLQEALAGLEARGYRRVVVQPLHIFPGYEYQSVVKVCEQFPGLRIIVGEPLLYRWKCVQKVLNAVKQHFLSREEGFNILVGHGTPMAADQANIVYIGLEWFLETHYPNVVLGTVEGIPDAESILQKAINYPGPRVRFVPFMYVAGDHIMNDIMGKGLDKLSWYEQLERAGKKIDCISITFQGKTYYKGLGFYPEVNQLLLSHLKRALNIIDIY